MDACRPPRLLDQVRAPLRTRHYSYRTDKSHVGWIRRFILFHGKRHPREMGATEIEAFLTHLAVNRNVASATQNQALNAILFLYREVLGVDLPWLANIRRAKKPSRLPTVLTRTEVRAVLAQLEGAPWLIASLLYGSGLRLAECCRLRVKDVDFAMQAITVRDGKGGKDRSLSCQRQSCRRLRHTWTKSISSTIRISRRGWVKCTCPMRSQESTPGRRPNGAGSSCSPRRAMRRTRPYRTDRPTGGERITASWPR